MWIVESFAKFQIHEEKILNEIANDIKAMITLSTGQLRNFNNQLEINLDESWVGWIRDLSLNKETGQIILHGDYGDMQFNSLNPYSAFNVLEAVSKKLYGSYSLIEYPSKELLENLKLNN